ncbi:hypothetical protein [Alteribacter aurantiacus]|uniref:hypothetical protein n=1 Tax=Alteribacter aurantiacus TaxID=254410 RepID=UPI0004070796|nr:hypothetical protein [Alteribacter aurantiacus]
MVSMVLLIVVVALSFIVLLIFPQSYATLVPLLPTIIVSGVLSGVLIAGIRYGMNPDIRKFFKIQPHLFAPVHQSILIFFFIGLIFVIAEYDKIEWHERFDERQAERVAAGEDGRVTPYLNQSERNVGFLGFNKIYRVQFYLKNHMNEPLLAIYKIEPLSAETGEPLHPFEGWHFIEAGEYFQPYNVEMDEPVGDVNWEYEFYPISSAEYQSMPDHVNTAYESFLVEQEEEREPFVESQGEFVLISSIMWFFISPIVQAVFFIRERRKSWKMFFALQLRGFLIGLAFLSAFSFVVNEMIRMGSGGFL